MSKFTKKEISNIKLLWNLVLHTGMGEPLKVKSTRDISFPYLGARSYLSRMISYFAGLKSEEFAAHQDEFYIDDYDFVYRDNAFFTFKPDTYTFDELVDIVVKYAEKRSLDESTLYEGYFSRIADKLADDKYQEDTAKEIAIDWHGGQWSPLYKVACGNLAKMTKEDIQDAIKEVNGNLKSEVCRYDPKQAKRLELLKAILEDRA